MSVADQSGAPAGAAHQTLFTVRLSPQFVNRLSGRLRRSVPSESGVHGLLFGINYGDLVYVLTFRSFLEAEGERDTSPQGASEAFEQLAERSRTDPEISSLEIVGWYGIRSAGGLLGGDVAFHEQHFGRSTDVALIVRPEETNDMLFEVYSRSDTAMLTDESHRWGSLRLNGGTNLAGAIDVAMRPKLDDSYYFRAYESGEQPDKERSIWRRVLDLPTRSKRDARPPAPLDQNFGNVPPSPTITPYQEPPPATTSVPAPAAGSQPFQHDRSLHDQTLHDRTLHDRTFHDRVLNGSLPPIYVGETPGVPALFNRPKQRGIPWLSSIIVFAIAAGVTFAFVFFRGLPSAQDPSRFLRAFLPDNGLGLKLEAQGDAVLLSWNRRNPIVRSTSGGVLHIDDGAQHRDVLLDAAQVANGGVLYRPSSGDVNFRLEVRGDQGNTVAESMRMLDPTKDSKAPEPLDLSAPATPPPSSYPPPEIVEAPAQIIPRNVPPPAPSPAAASNQQITRGTALQDLPLATPARPQPRNLESGPTDSSSPEPSAAHSAMVQQSLPSAAPPMQPTNQRPISPEQQPRSTTRAAEAVRQNVQSAPPSTQAYYQPPRATREVLPNVRILSPTALASVSRVSVAVRIDATGRVREAHVVRNGQRLSGSLEGAIIAAARGWGFAPATVRGVPVATDHIIVFQFQQPGR